MTLLITIFAAVIATVIWYKQAPEDTMNVSTLCFLYWGAAIMWFVDVVAEYMEYKAAYFTPAVSEIINDTFLGLSVVAFGLVIWVVTFLVKDPKGVLQNVMVKK